MLQDSPQPSPKWDRSLVTAFPSPATAALFRASIPGSMVRPATSLSHNQLPCPFGPSAPLPLPVRPGPGRFIASGPLQFRWPLPPAATPASTPLWGFYPPSDQSVQPVSLPVGPPSESARFPLAPRCRSFFNYGRGSSFLGRYVSGGLLFLKPLGTSFTMLPFPFGVNDYSDR
jgi:hypothetical protein